MKYTNLSTLLLMIILSTSASPVDTMNTSVMDLTLKHKVALTTEESREKHSMLMQSELLKFEREKLSSDERIAKSNASAVSQQSSTTLNTKNILYFVGGAFILGTIGTFRGVTRVSNGFLNAKDWTVKKSKEVWNTLLHREVIEISKEEYENIKEEVSRVNDALDKAKHECSKHECSKHECSKEEINDESLQDIPGITIDREKKSKEWLDKNRIFNELCNERVRKYRASSIIYDGEGISDVDTTALDSAGNPTGIKRLANIAVSLPILGLNVLIRPFTKKQIKFFFPFKGDWFPKYDRDGI